MTDPQLDNTSPEEKSFSDELRAVFGDCEWDITQDAKRSLAATYRAVSVYVENYGLASQWWTVEMDDVADDSSNLKTAAERVRERISNAVAALESLGWKVDP